MLMLKIKENTKLKSNGKCDLMRKQLCSEEYDFVQNKVGYKDVMNEIFAGLMWLG